MKVAMLTYLGEESGVYTHVKNIATRISKVSNVELHIIAIGDEDIIINKFGATVHFIKKKGVRGATYFYYPLLFRKKILAINPDIIHVQGYMRHYYIALALMKKYPTILTLHANISEELKYRLSPSLKQYISQKIEPYLEKRLLKKAERVIVPSPHMKEYFGAVKDGIRVIPNGVDFEEIQNRGQVKGDIIRPAVLFTGRLEKIKGVDILIRSIAIVVRSIPDVHLYIAGSGEEECKLKYLVKKLDIEESVTFLGFVSEEEKWSYYRSADLCVVPSVEEPFGIVLLEAMACGKPVVASMVGGILYVVEDGKTGSLFECGNVEDLAEKVIILLQNKELREMMGATGLEKAKEFSWDKIADRTVELYKDALEK
jgi:glycosyltransferase involved in cell wall biosynthesis